jgi:hypothetical protein
MATGSSSPLLVPCDPPSPAGHDRSFPGSDIELVSLAPTFDHSITEQSVQNADYDPTRATHSMARSEDTNTASLRDDDDSSVRTLPRPLESGKPSTMSRLLDTWTCEIVATTFSIGCLVAITAVVGAYDGERIPQLVSGLTLNTIISVLSTAARSSLVFVVSAAVGQLKWCWLKRSVRQVRDIQAMDEASRGPLGAIGVIAFWTGGNLAAMGSFVTILMIAFSPFVQQLVQYPSRSAIQRDAIALAPQNKGYTELTNLTEVLEAGTWSVLKSFDQEPICPTSRCSWPTFHSTGWCSKCEDRLQSARLSPCRPGPILQDSKPWRYCVADLGSGANTSLLENGLEDIYGSNPQDPNTTVSYVAEVIWPVSYGGIGLLRHDGPIKSPALIENNTKYMDVHNPLMVFGHVAVRHAQVSEVRDDLDYDLLHITEASQCVLSLCDQSLSLKKVDGITTWVDESTNYGDLFKAAIDVPSHPEGQHVTPTSICWQAESRQNNSVVTNQEDLTYLKKSKRTFCGVDVFAEAVEAHLAGHYSGTFDFPPPGGGSPSAKRTVPNIVGPNSTRNLSQRIESIANALTNHGLATTNDTVRGDAYAEELYVRVRWQWIILPAFLELASLVLLVLTIIHSQREDVPIWKSSVLALMYHGMDDLHDRGTLASERLSGMELIAKGADIQLVKNEDGVNSLAMRSGYTAVTEHK